MRNGWWRTHALRVIKKNFSRPYHDGTLYTWRTWVITLRHVRALKPGDEIYNPWTHTKTRVTKVHYDWSRYKNIRHISGFTIEVESGYWLYDDPIFLEHYGKSNNAEEAWLLTYG